MLSAGSLKDAPFLASSDGDILLWLRPKAALWIKTETARGFIQDRRSRTDVPFIRARSTIRADGSPSAPVLTPSIAEISCGCQGGFAGVARYRAPTVLLVRIKSHPSQKYGYG